MSVGAPLIELVPSQNIVHSHIDREFAADDEIGLGRRNPRAGAFEIQVVARQACAALQIAFQYDTAAERGFALVALLTDDPAGAHGFRNTPAPEQISFIGSGVAETL